VSVRCCAGCGRITTELEASLRRFNTGRCADCNGTLEAACDRCYRPLQIGEWPFCPHGFPYAGVAVIDDQIEGGPRMFDTMGHDEVYIESKSQWKREVAARGLENVVRHDSAYYAKQRRMHDERLRDTGRAD